MSGCLLGLVTNAGLGARRAYDDDGQATTTTRLGDGHARKAGKDVRAQGDDDDDDEGCLPEGRKGRRPGLGANEGAAWRKPAEGKGK